MTDSNPTLDTERRVPLGLARRGFRGHIDAIAAADAPSGSRRRSSSGACSNSASSKAPMSKSCMRAGRPRSHRRARQRRHDRAAPPRGDGDPRDLTRIDRNDVRRAETSAWRLRPGRHAEQRQDRAVQCADRQPAEGRELSGRHRRAQGRRAPDAVRPSRQSDRPARHLFAARPQPRRGDHARRRARPARQRGARPTCCSASPTPPTCAWRCAW